MAPKLAKLGLGPFVLDMVELFSCHTLVEMADLLRMAAEEKLLERHQYYACIDKIAFAVGDQNRNSSLYRKVLKRLDAKLLADLEADDGHFYAMIQAGAESLRVFDREYGLEYCVA